MSDNRRRLLALSERALELPIADNTRESIVDLVDKLIADDEVLSHKDYTDAARALRRIIHYHTRRTQR